jgi:hypothetical protein
MSETAIVNMKNLKEAMNYSDERRACSTCYYSRDEQIGEHEYGWFCDFALTFRVSAHGSCSQFKPFMEAKK